VDVPVRAWREYKKKGRLCNIPGCEQPHAARGWCDVHYKRWKAHGDPTALLQAAPRQADHYTTKGYHIIYANGRAVQEHRHVMEQHLGRPLLPNENVHHRDGNKARNDIGNLELWITHQPSGQRVADLVAFVVERYAEQVARMLREQRRGARPTEHPTLW